MNYFLTGATGFIGKRLAKKLLERKAAVLHVLLRPESLHKLEDLRKFCGSDAKRIVAVEGDLLDAKLGISAAALKSLKGQIDHFFHLAAVYDLKADAEVQMAANVDGSRHAVQAAAALGAKHFHHLSSIAAAGLYEGVFREDMFDEADNLDHPYFRSKHDSEAVVRRDCAKAKLPFTVYRPSMVVGDSQTGEIDKIDGPYYLFKLIQRMRQMLPAWMPMVGVEGGRINLVPVDYVVRCLDFLAHSKNTDGQCYHIVDPQGHRVGDLLDVLAKAAHAPKLNVFVNAALLGFIPKSIASMLFMFKPVARVRAAVMKDLGLPEDIFQFINYPTRFDRRALDAQLSGSGIELPKLDDYAWRLWDYWERHLDPDLFIDRSLKGAVAGKVVLVTGGSSGIGLASAHKFSQAGAVTIICGREQDKLDAACAEAKERGYRFHAYSVDLSNMQSIDEFSAQLLTDHSRVDMLINNAGRSIRRAIENSHDRFHDFERTMQLNYFGCLRLTMNLLPEMVKHKRGHIVNISSIGVLTNAPRFSAYVASKAALDAWTRCAASEYADTGVTFSTINMPLVRTPMIAPTAIYNNVPTLSPEEAADLVARACISKEVRIATRLGITGQVLHALFPRIMQIVMNTSFRMFPDSSAAQGDTGKDRNMKRRNKNAVSNSPKLSVEAVALQQMMRGIHF